MLGLNVIVDALEVPLMPVNKLVENGAAKAKPARTGKQRPASVRAGKKAEAASGPSERLEAVRMLGDIETRAQAAADRARLVLQRLS
jgi:hypothetical protein